VDVEEAAESSPKPYLLLGPPKILDKIANEAPVCGIIAPLIAKQAIRQLPSGGPRQKAKTKSQEGRAEAEFGAKKSNNITVLRGQWRALFSAKRPHTETGSPNLCVWAFLCLHP